VANRRSYKSDVSFLEKISIGAVGTHRVYEDLRQQGHIPIELERGSMSFKIWKAIKIKRIRVPDILCIDCGRRVESRAKTRLQISIRIPSPIRNGDGTMDSRMMILSRWSFVNAQGTSLWTGKLTIWCNTFLSGNCEPPKMLAGL
jgi:hypothetical protein